MATGWNSFWNAFSNSNGRWLWLRAWKCLLQMVILFVQYFDLLFCVSSYLATASLHSPSLFGFFLSIFLLGRGNFSTLVILVNQSANQTVKQSVNQSILDKFSTFGILFTNRSILPPSIIPTIRPRSILLNQIKSWFFCQHLFPLFNTCSHLFFHKHICNNFPYSMQNCSKSVGSLSPQPLGKRTDPRQLLRELPTASFLCHSTFPPYLSDLSNALELL